MLYVVHIKEKFFPLTGGTSVCGFVMGHLMTFSFFRGRHASKVTEEEEDEEYLKDEDELSGNTRLVAQPSCKIYFDASVFVYMMLLNRVS